MMKILFITYDFPYPLTSGGKIRAYQIIRYLSKVHEVTLFSYIRVQPAEKDLDKIRPFCRKIELFPRGKAWSLKHLITAGFSFLPGAIAHYVNPSFERSLVTELTREKYDAVHFESFYASLYLPLVKSLGVKTVLGNENVEYEVYQRFIENLRGIKRYALLPLLKYDLFKMQRFEKERWRQADVNLAVSGEDAKIISTAAASPVIVVPNGVDTESFSYSFPEKNNQNDLLFIGDLNYIQNNQGIKSFLEEIFPIVRRRVPTVTLKIVSASKPAWWKENQSGISLIQDNTTPFSGFTNQAEIFINPVVIKGGTRIKLLEALAAGLPVVTYASSLIGFSKLQSGRDLIACDNPLAFAEAIIRLLTDKSFGRRLGAAGRILVESHYTWEKALAALSPVYPMLNYENPNH